MRLVRNRKQDTLTEPSPSSEDWQDPEDQVIEEEAVQPDMLDADGEDGDESAPSDGRKGRLRWLLSGIGVGAVAAVVVLLLLRTDTKAGGPPVASPTPTIVPSQRVPFEFALTSVTATSYTGQNGSKAARRTGELVRVLLSRFYDAGFVNPDEWALGPPGDMWAVFARNVAARAKTRATALTMGKVKGLKSLEIDRTRLVVNVLVDPSHRAVSAIATVSFDATGHLENGDLLAVSNDAQFFLRPIDGRWTIVGYPEARTTLKERPAPSPTPVPGPSGSASASAPAAAPASP